MSCLYLDQMRIEANRDGMFFWCVHHKDSKANQFSQMNLLQKAFKQLGFALQNTAVKVKHAIEQNILLVYFTRLVLFQT